MRPPDISVVIASFRDGQVLDACLRSLIPQCEDASVELIVARADEPSALSALASAFPAVRFVPVARNADLPRIRGAGLAAATGQLVVLTEDHCVADVHWVDTMRRYVGSGLDVVGGAMDNAQPRRALDWGAFFAEYGFFSALASPAVGGPPPLLTGANVAYARRVLPDVAAWMSAGGWENVVHDRLRAGGAAFAFEPSARVGQNLTYAFGSFLADRFRHGRDYARARLAERPGSNRWVRIIASLLLPPLLTVRVARTATGSPARAVAFTRALPFTLSFFGAWAAGEAVGYLRGPSSTSQVTAS